MKRAIFLMLAALSLVGCESWSIAPDSDMIFDEVIVQNHSSRSLEAFKLVDIDANRYFGCSLILPNSSCSIAFSKRRSEQHQAELRWQEGKQSYQQRLEAEWLESARAVKKVYIDIYPGGYFEAVVR